MIKPYFFFSFFLLVLCENVFSQSTFSLPPSENPPFLVNKDYVHGMGVYTYNDQVADTTIKRACESSMQDLHSNTFLSVYIEIFQDGNQKYYEFPELSVMDSSFTFSEEVHSVETQINNGFVYCFSSTDNSLKEFTSNIPDLESLALAPISKNGIWYSLGITNELVNNKNRSWLIAKNEAAKRLSKTISTSITENFAYFKTNIIYRNIVVAKRVIMDGKYYSVIAVSGDDITSF